MNMNHSENESKQHAGPNLADLMDIDIQKDAALRLVSVFEVNSDMTLV